MGPTSNRDKVTVKGIVVEYDAAKGGDIKVTTAQGAFSFPMDASLWAAPRQFLDGRVEVRAAPQTAILDARAESRRRLSVAARSQRRHRSGWPIRLTSEGDQILVRRRAPGGAWSKPEELTPPGGDHFRTAIAEDRAGKIWVVWSSQVSGNFDLYARAFDGKAGPPPSASPARRARTSFTP